MKAGLFDNDGGAAEDEAAGGLKINKHYAQRFQEAKRRQELSRAKDLASKGLLDEGENTDEDEEEDEDETGRRIGPGLDAKIFSALNMIKNRDPSIYQPDNQFFDPDDAIDVGVSEGDGQNDENDISEKSKKQKAHKPVYLKDLLARQATDGSDEDERGAGRQKSYVESQADLKREFLQLVDKFDDGDSQDQFLKKRKKSKKEIVEEEKEVADLRKRLDEKNAKENASLILKRYFGKEEELNKDERFLRNYLLNSGWVDKDDDEEDVTAHDDSENEFNSEEESAFDEAAEKFESEYNFRFEERGSEKIVVHPREVPDTLRKDRKAETRKRARERKKQREDAITREREEELKRLKNIKKKELRKRLEKIRESAGLQNPDEIALAEVDLEGEFDSKEYDRKMAQIFGDNYYNSTVDEDKPPISDLMDDETGILGANDGQKKGFKAARDRVASSLSGVKEDIAAFKTIMDEYYKLGGEDYVDGKPTRFKYTSVKPSQYGLDWEDMLGMDDKDLNAHVSLKKLAPYKEDDGEKMVLKKMKKKKWLEKKSREDTENKTENSGKEVPRGFGSQRKDTYATVKPKKRKE